MKTGTIIFLAPVILALGCGGAGTEARKAAAEQRARDAEKDYRARLAAYEKMLRTSPNARCPNPRCRHLMRISDAQARNSVQCKICLARFSGKKARLAWPQVSPPVPPASPNSGGLRGIIGRFFG